MVGKAMSYPGRNLKACGTMRTLEEDRTHLAKA
jgi:hypothetical protein